MNRWINVASLLATQSRHTWIHLSCKFAKNTGQAIILELLQHKCKYIKVNELLDMLYQHMLFSGFNTLFGCNYHNNSAANHNIFKFYMLASICCFSTNGIIKKTGNIVSLSGSTNTLSTINTIPCNTDTNVFDYITHRRWIDE